MNKVKEVNYRGILKFNIPSDWIEEYDEYDGGTFYEDNPVSGTLRIKLMTLKKPSDKINISSTVILNEIIPKGSDSELLANSNALKMFYEQTTESGHDITIYYWSLLQVGNSESAHLANFSYTILNKRLGIESVRKEIEFITNQIKDAKFRSE